MILFRERRDAPPRSLRPSVHAPAIAPCEIKSSRVFLACTAGAPAARSAVAGLGAGVGVGMGYTDCKHEFDAVDKASAAK